MAGLTGKQDIKLLNGIASRGEARVINGRLRVRFVTRDTPPDEGYGSAQIWGGVAAHDEAEVINGALKIRIA